MSEEKWEDAFTTAVNALEHAYKVIDDIAGWSGASGNWPLQESWVKVRDALKTMREGYWPNDCECYRSLDGVKFGTWFGPCEDGRNHKIGCPVANRASAKTPNEPYEEAARVCESMVVGGRAWTEEQALCAQALFEAAKQIRALRKR